MTISPMPSAPATVCQCFDAEAVAEYGCLCGDDERALRAWAYPSKLIMPPMTAEQRAWCLSQIRQAGDATDQPDDDSLTLWTDRDYASGALSAWVDYCRDKGLL